MYVMSDSKKAEILTEENFLMYAMRVYQNPTCLNIEEFNDDLKRVKYVKRLLNRYKEGGVLKERLILNHIIVLYNVFGPDAATRILFFKLSEKFWPELKTFLIYLHYMPFTITGIYEETILSSDIPINVDIANCLRKI